MRYIIALLAVAEPNGAMNMYGFNQNETNNAALEIKKIELDQVPTVKRMITQCAFELWKPEMTYEKFVQKLDSQDEFEDLVDISASYLKNNGTFLVLLDHGVVVGCGAIRKFNSEICELMRLWFYKEYRGRGLGLKMANQLIEFARQQGYKKMRLDVYYPEIQTAAVALYKKLGFYEIAPYNKYPAKLWMEKVL